MPDDNSPELPLPPPPGDSGPGALNIQPVNIEEEMRRSYLDYSMSVIIGRALPDVRDGLKPVHRRILYTMQQMGLQPNRATRKCCGVANLPEAGPQQREDSVRTPSRAESPRGRHMATGATARQVTVIFPQRLLR
jgi:hypothetical protein